MSNFVEFGREYSIPEDRFKEFEAKIKKVKKQCEKYDCGFGLKLIGKEERVIKDGDRKYVVPCMKIKVAGTAVINGWEFIGVLEHKEGGNIFRTYAGKTINPEYRMAPPKCDHCNTLRNRKDTYIVQNIETGVQKQVGKSCLMAYTKGWSADRVACVMSVIDVMKEAEACNDADMIKYAKHMFSTGNVMKAAFILKNKGKTYAKRFNDNGAVSNYEEIVAMISGRANSDTEVELRNLGIDETTLARDTSVDMNDAYKDIIEFIKSNPDNEYAKNIAILAQSTHCESRDFGLIAWLPYAIERSKRKKEEEERKKNSNSKSIWHYKEGDKVELKGCKVTAGYSYNTMYGDYTYYEILNGDDVYMWKSTKSVKNGIYDIKGTVLENKENEGVKQTWLTRCRLTQA